MSIRYRDVGLRWGPVKFGAHADGNGFVEDVARGRKFERRLEAILTGWEHTPYSPSIIKQGPDGGVFCTAFVARVLDELFRQDPMPLPDIPHDTAMHNAAKARAALRWFLRNYPGSIPIKSRETEEGLEVWDVQPGDIVISGPIGGGPGHAMIVGPRQNIMWQADGQRVHYTGLYLPEPYELHDVRRFYQREEWV